MTPPDDPWHVFDQLDFSPPTISNHSLLATEQDGSPALLMVHLHARILYEVRHEELQRTWIFPQDILAFVWADTSSSPYPILIVATVDGRIWSIMGQGPPTPLSSQKQTPESVKEEVKVKQEPELIVIDEEEDEIELWNDEVGLLLKDVDFDAVPANKRQRTQSPPSMETDPRPSIAVLIVSASKDLLGSEENITNMVFAFGGLLIFRENSDPILWSTPEWKANTPIRKCVLHFDYSLTHITALLASNRTPGKARKGSSTLYVGTKTGHVFSVIISDLEDDNPRAKQKLLDPKVEEKPVDPKVEEKPVDPKPVVSILLSDDLILVAVGSSGRVFESDLGESQNIRKPCVFQIGTPIRHAFSAEAFYFLSVEGQIYRKSGAEELHRSETPPMCALTSTLNRIYGFNTSGQVLEFSQDFHRYFHPVSTLSIREGISASLSELEQASEEIKILERQCQVENQRIATFNRIVHELQQFTMTQSQQEKTQGHSTPPVDITTTTFIQPVLMGSREPRRHTVRLTITSAIDLDWSAGWSVGICLSPAPTSCPHENQQRKPGLCQQEFGSLETFSRHSPSTVDLELDLKLMWLPLKMSMSLFYLEPTTDTKDPTYQYNTPLSARFFVFDMELDALCFAEPVTDLEKRRQPPVMSIASAGTELWVGFGDCSLCQSEIQKRMATPLAPLVVRLDEDITVDQCLSALVVDGLPRDKAIGILQNAYKAVMTIGEDCLPHSGPRSIESSKAAPPDLGIVWVVLEPVGEASGEMEVAITVKGQDPRRVMTVYQALEKRIKLLFE
ncbi:hypothetical protein BGZ82_000548 [Podila clonocystis]|nr:hypothetical protein BGZ82_000548 [Podila clonocystis]